MKNEEYRLKDVFILTGWSILLALCSIFVPIIGIITSFFWYVPLVILSVKGGMKGLLIGYGVLGMALIILASPVNAFFFMLHFSLIAITYSLLFMKKASFPRLVYGGLIAAVTGAFLRIAAIMALFGITYTEWLGIMRDMADETIRMYKEAGNWEDLVGGAVTGEELKEALYTLSEIMANLTPAAFASYGMLVAFVGLLVTIKVLQRKGLPVPHIPDFICWRVPWPLVWPVIMGLSCLLLGDYLGNKLLMVVGQNIVYIFIPVFLTVGLAVTAFFLNKWRVAGVFKVVVLVIIVFNLPVFLMLILLLGMFDPLINIRKLN